MKLPEPAPALNDVLEHCLDQVLDARRQGLTGTEGTRRYLHWDDLKHREPPGGLSREAWWGLLSWDRAGRPAGVVDRDEAPFRIVRTAHVDRLLLRVDQSIAGRIEVPGRGSIRPSGDRYVISSVMEEAITSSQLEGASTTRRIAKQMLREGRKPRNHDERMIWNNYRALQFIRESQDRDLDMQLLLHLHRLVTENALDEPDMAGRLRTTDDIQVIHRPTGTVLHDPPPAKVLPERLEHLFAFANKGVDDHPFLHPVLRAITLHFQLAYEHPFVDGNGRVARILFYWSMLRSGYWLAEYLSVSRILKKAPQQYARAFLLTETDHGDLTYFVIHQLDVIDRAIDELHTFIGRATARTDSARQLARTIDHVNARQLALLDHALRHPDATYEIAIHQGYHSVSYPTARADLLTLAQRGLLLQRREGRKLIFLVPEGLQDRLQLDASRASESEAAG